MHPGARQQPQQQRAGSGHVPFSQQLSRGSGCISREKNAGCGTIQHPTLHLVHRRIFREQFMMRQLDHVVKSIHTNILPQHALTSAPHFLHRNNSSPTSSLCRCFFEWNDGDFLFFQPGQFIKTQGGGPGVLFEEGRKGVSRRGELPRACELASESSCASKFIFFSSCQAFCPPGGHSLLLLTRP